MRVAVLGAAPLFALALLALGIAGAPLHPPDR
jgi:hypothetical protein